MIFDDDDSFDFAAAHDGLIAEGRRQYAILAAQYGHRGAVERMAAKAEDMRLSCVDLIQEVYGDQCSPTPAVQEEIARAIKSREGNGP